MTGLRICRYAIGIWANLVLGPADKTPYVSRTGGCK